MFKCYICRNNKDMNQKDILTLKAKMEHKSPQEIIAWFLNEFKGKIALSNSMGAEDQVLTDMICKIDSTTPIFTLDTGRIFPETYDLIDRTNNRYGINIHVYFPKSDAVQEMVNKNGVNLFFNSIENRKLCCNTRKIEPLKRAFLGLKVWICGLRKEQSVTRTEVDFIEWDENNGLIKLNPIIEWKEDQMWDYIKENNVPYNKLHDKGFPSIGCEPCTRAIKEGEDLRAGRWWWENPDSKECGLHIK